MFININSNRMKFTTSLILGLVFLSIVNCKTSQESVVQFQSTAPLEITAPYYNSWIAGFQGGGSGVNVFLPLKENGNIVIDSLHFRGEKTAVETRDKLIVGRFRHSTVLLATVSTVIVFIIKFQTSKKRSRWLILLHRQKTAKQQL